MTGRRGAGAPGDRSGFVREVREVEVELARFYQAERGRGDRPVGGRRLAARSSALTGALAAVSGAVLDLGSGPGRDTTDLRDAGLMVVAVDLVPASARLAGRPAVAASAVELPLATGSVGGVWSMSALMHVPDVAIVGALGELARVVAPGGPVLLGTWGGDDREARPVSAEVDLPRLFSLRSDDRWRALLEDHLGVVQRFEVWPEVGGDDWHYQFVEVSAAG